MTNCNDTENICTLNGVFQFEVENDICIAWTDENKSSSDSLIIHIYENDRKIFIIDGGTSAIQSRMECRIIPITVYLSLSPGSYKTEFVVNGRPVEQVSWEIKQPPPPTPVAPPYSIENPRMALCNSDINVCQIKGVSQFSSNDRVCTAWTEVGRRPNDSFAFLVYNEKNEQIISHVESTIDSTITRSCRVEQIENPKVSGSYQTEFTANGRPVEKILWSIIPSQTLYHIRGEVGCINQESTIFFEGDVDTAINDGEFLVKGKGTDYSPDSIIYVEVNGKFTGKEIVSGEIRMYDESYKENSQNKPFRIDSFEGVFHNLELYSDAQEVVSGGCHIFTKILLETPKEPPNTPIPKPIDCINVVVTKNLFPQLAGVEGQYPIYGPVGEPRLLCQAVYDIVHDRTMAVHIKFESYQANYAWWGVAFAKMNPYNAASHSQICFWAYAKEQNQSFKLKMKDTAGHEKGVVITIDKPSEWQEVCTDVTEFVKLGIKVDSLENFNLGFETPTGSAEVWVADFEFR